MIVVSDTSVLSALAGLGHFDLLSALFQRVIIPSAVQEEFLDRAQEREARSALIARSWIEVRSPASLDRVSRLAPKLGRGETAALALALELDAILLIDEAKGRAVAARLGLSVTGAAGLLVRAKKRGLLPRVRPELERLRGEFGFHMSDQVFTQVIAAAGE